MRIVVAGIIGRYPWGGVMWCSLMYLLGLRGLGHEVYYLEDTCECNYDPEIQSPATEPGYALRYISESLAPFGFGERWRYVDFRGESYGISDSQWKDVCRSADLLIVLSGGVWIWRDEYLRIPMKVFIDSDPGFTQLTLATAQDQATTDSGKAWYADFFRQYDRLFTFGHNIGQEGCSIPTCGLQWHPTTQPINLQFWKPSSLPSRPVWTTVMTWQIESFKDVGGNKDEEFLKILNLASRCRESVGPELELAVNGPRSFLSQHGWRCIDAEAASYDLWRYHGYLTSSRGEFSVAKQTYVQARSGWFSDRTACYLAAGRPAVVQDTGQGRWLPVGSGLLTWSSEDEAYDCLRRVDGDYLKHSKAARGLAEDFLCASKVLPPLLDKCCL